MNKFQKGHLIIMFIALLLLAAFSYYTHWSLFILGTLPTMLIGIIMIIDIKIFKGKYFKQKG